MPAVSKMCTHASGTQTTKYPWQQVFLALASRALLRAHLDFAPRELVKDRLAQNEDEDDKTSHLLTLSDLDRLRSGQLEKIDERIICAYIEAELATNSAMATMMVEGDARSYKAGSEDEQRLEHISKMRSS